MLARDKAIISDDDARPNQPCAHNPGCATVPILQALLGEDLSVPNSLPDQQTLCRRLLSDTLEVWLNFTYFVQLSVSIDEATPTMHGPLAPPFGTPFVKVDSL